MSKSWINSMTKTKNLVALGAGTYVALVFRAENVEEFIKTHGVKYVNLQKSYLISDNEIQEFWIGELHQTHLRKDRDDLWHQLRYVIKVMQCCGVFMKYIHRNLPSQEMLGYLCKYQPEIKKHRVSTKFTFYINLHSKSFTLKETVESSSFI